MKHYSLPKILFGAFLLWILTACGGGGKDSPPPPAAEDKDDPAPVVREITGNLALNLMNNPAKGFSILLFNHTTSEVHVTDVGDDGRFVFPLNLFRRREVYSFHILDVEFRYVTTVNFDDISGAVQYQGGQGFHLGDLMVAGNAFGVYDLAESRVQASASQGFFVDPLIPTDPAFFAMPEDIHEATMASELVILNETDLLEAVYQKTVYPAKYERLVNRYSRLGIYVDGKVSNPVTGIGLVKSGQWVQGARASKLPTDGPYSAPFWITSGYSLHKLNQDQYYAGVYPGWVPSGQEMLLMQVYTEGKTALVPLKPGKIVGSPPMIEGVGQSALPITSIDYVSHGAPTGLTIPVCRQSDLLRLRMSPPKDIDGLPLIYRDDISEINMKFTYFTRLDGQLSPIEVDPDDFPQPFHRPLQNSLLSLANREWLPKERLLRWIFKSSGIMMMHELPVFSELLLDHLLSVSKDVEQIRVDIIYKGDRIQTGVRFWLRNC